MHTKQILHAKNKREQGGALTRLILELAGTRRGLQRRSRFLVAIHGVAYIQPVRAVNETVWVCVGGRGGAVTA